MGESIGMAERKVDRKVDREQENGLTLGNWFWIWFAVDGTTGIAEVTREAGVQQPLVYALTDDLDVCGVALLVDRHGPVLHFQQCLQHVLKVGDIILPVVCRVTPCINRQQEWRRRGDLGKLCVDLVEPAFHTNKRQCFKLVEGQVSDADHMLLDERRCIGETCLQPSEGPLKFSHRKGLHTVAKRRTKMVDTGVQRPDLAPVGDDGRIGTESIDGGQMVLHSLEQPVRLHSCHYNVANDQLIENGSLCSGVQQIWCVDSKALCEVKGRCTTYLQLHWRTD